MQIPRIDAKNLLGFKDKLVGLGKEVAGTVVDNKRLTKAGQVQQDKGAERIKAVRAELDARKNQVKSATAERGQRAAQKRKEAVNG